MFLLELQQSGLHFHNSHEGRWGPTKEKPLRNEQLLPESILDCEGFWRTRLLEKERKRPWIEGSHVVVSGWQICTVLCTIELNVAGFSSFPLVVPHVSLHAYSLSLCCMQLTPPFLWNKVLYLYHPKSKAPIPRQGNYIPPSSLFDIAGTVGIRLSHWKNTGIPVCVRERLSCALTHAKSRSNKQLPQQTSLWPQAGSLWSLGQRALVRWR